MTNIDIIPIHKKILKQFENEDEQIEHIQLELIVLNDILEKNKNLTYRNKQQLLSKKDHLVHLRDTITSKNSLHFYLLQATPLLEQYKEILEQPLKLSFMGKPEKPDTQKKDNLVKKFLQIACKYSIDDIGYMENNKQNHKTSNNCCENPVIEYTTTNSVCTNCGVQMDDTEITFSYNDTERVNIVSKYTYARSIHFRDCINQFQGKQNSTISDDVYNKLIEQFELHRLLVPDDPNPYKNITKSHIYMFLKETNYSGHYEDVNLIYHNITGHPLDNISHLEATLIDDFDRLNALYDEKYIKTKKIDRKNFINTKYVLYQLLRRHKYPCKREDFQLLKTTERKAFHDEICSDLFKELNWNFYSSF
jgi:hypothetical protein